LEQLPVRVFPVGRLDMDVEGLLILTNDGPLAKRLMHPSSKIPKIYRVKVSGRPDAEALEELRSGQLMLGDRPAAPAEAEMIKIASDRAWLLLTLTEGRHHQVKRMCSAIGHPVLKLKRVSYAGLELGALRREMIRPLSPPEVRQLMLAAQLDELQTKS
jgi:pseudouridine synthase